MDTITDEERKIVEELRKRTMDDVTPKMQGDVSVFYRFAKARDFNLGKAETMLRNHIAWRKEMGTDTILTDYKPPEVFLKYIPITIACFDKEGCPVIVHDLGRADSKGFMNVATKTEILKYVTYFSEKSIERAIKQSEIGKTRFQLGKPVLAPIYDFDELTYAKAMNLKNLQLIVLIVQTFIDNYPECLRTITVINAPFYFTWLYASLKPLLPSSVIQKVRIYGSDGWKEALLETTDPDDLPAYLGGTRTDPDGNPLCETFIRRGRPIPKKYYVQKENKNVGLESDVEKLTVMPFSKKEITFTVTEENSYLEWEFEMNGKDIDFLLLFKKTPEDFESVELIPKQKIDTTVEQEKGYFKCEKVGNYTIVFDNSYSWIHPKEVHYRARIRSPNSNGLFESS